MQALFGHNSHAGNCHMWQLCHACPLLRHENMEHLAMMERRGLSQKHPERPWFGSPTSTLLQKNMEPREESHKTGFLQTDCFLGPC